MQSLIRKCLALAAAAYVSAWAIPSPAGEVLATSSAYAGIRLNTVRPIILRTQGEAEGFSDWPLTYRAGETVTATAPDGTSRTLASEAASAGNVRFSPNAGGLWLLSNSFCGTVPVGVSWAAFNDGWSVNSVPAFPVRMDTNGEGPDRRVRKPGPFPAISYTGDGWAGASSASSTLTLVSPKGGTPSTTVQMGTGTTPFAPDEAGVWTIELAFGTSELVGHVRVVDSGTFLIVR